MAAQLVLGKEEETKTCKDEGQDGPKCRRRMWTRVPVLTTRSAGETRSERKIKFPANVIEERPLTSKRKLAKLIKQGMKKNAAKERLRMIQVMLICLEDTRRSVSPQNALRLSTGETRSEKMQRI